jgi:hypothetical protein
MLAESDIRFTSVHTLRKQNKPTDAFGRWTTNVDGVGDTATACTFQKDESLQKLYNDIFRLLALANPGPANATSTIVGRDAFIDTLGNQTLRVRVLEHEPINIEQVLNIASRLEAYDRLTIVRSAMSEMMRNSREAGVVIYVSSKMVVKSIAP